MNHLSSLLPVTEGSTTLPFLRFSCDKVKTQESFHKPLGRFPLTPELSSQIHSMVPELRSVDRLSEDTRELTEHHGSV